MDDSVSNRLHSIRIILLPFERDVRNGRRSHVESAARAGHPGSRSLHQEIREECYQKQPERPAYLERDEIASAAPPWYHRDA